MDRILNLRGSLAKSAGALPEGDALRKTVTDFDGKVDAVRQQLVAITEGGAITGQQQLARSHDQLCAIDDFAPEARAGHCRAAGEGRCQ
jgi:hypothetical protein